MQQATDAMGATGQAATAEDVLESLTAAELCERYADRVYRFAAMVSRGSGEAEELAQDALERAIRRVESFDAGRGSVDAWLWRIVVNASRDAGRVRTRRWLLLKKLEYEYTRDRDEATAPAIDDGIGDVDLLQAVRRLGQRDRALIALRFGGGLDHAGVGTALGMSPAAAGVAVRRALARLRRYLESTGNRRGT